MTFHFIFDFAARFSRWAKKFRFRLPFLDIIIDFVSAFKRSWRFLIKRAWKMSRMRTDWLPICSGIRSVSTSDNPFMFCRNACHAKKCKQQLLVNFYEVYKINLNSDDSTGLRRLLSAHANALVTCNQAILKSFIKREFYVVGRVFGGVFPKFTVSSSIFFNPEFRSLSLLKWVTLRGGHFRCRGMRYIIRTRFCRP